MAQLYQAKTISPRLSVLRSYFAQNRRIRQVEIVINSRIALGCGRRLIQALQQLLQRIRSRCFLRTRSNLVVHSHEFIAHAQMFDETRTMIFLTIEPKLTIGTQEDVHRSMPNDRVQGRHAEASHDGLLALDGDEFSPDASSLKGRMIDEIQTDEHLGHFQHVRDRCLLRVERVDVRGFRAHLPIEGALPIVPVDQVVLRNGASQIEGEMEWGGYLFLREEGVTKEFFE